MAPLKGMCLFAYHYILFNCATIAWYGKLNGNFSDGVNGINALPLILTVKQWELSSCESVGADAAPDPADVG